MTMKPSRLGDLRKEEDQECVPAHRGKAKGGKQRSRGGSRPYRPKGKANQAGQEHPSDPSYFGKGKDKGGRGKGKGKAKDKGDKGTSYKGAKKRKSEGFG